MAWIIVSTADRSAQQPLHADLLIGSQNQINPSATADLPVGTP